AGILLVRLPVPDVQLAADDVPVAAQHIVAAACQPLVEDRPQPVHHLELVALAQLAGRAGGNVERNHGEIAEARLDVAPFLVERFPAQRGSDLVGLAPGVDGHSAIALLGGRVAEERPVAVYHELRRGELVLLGLGLLHAQDVGILLAEPVEKALAGSRTYAVGVEADDAHVLPVSRKGTRQCRPGRIACRRPGPCHARRYHRPSPTTPPRRLGRPPLPLPQPRAWRQRAALWRV